MFLRVLRALSYQKLEKFKFSNMSSLEEQTEKKIRLNSGESVPSNNVINNSKDKIDDEQEIDKFISEGKMVREQDVGITEYTDPSIPGFLGVVKQRYYILIDLMIIIYRIVNYLVNFFF